MSPTIRRAVWIVTALIFATSGPAFGQAPSRLNDRDIQNMIKNLSQDARTFRSTFTRAISSSTIRKTTQAKDAKTVAQRFQNETAGMLRQFQSSKKVDTSLPSVLQSAKEIEKIKSSVELGPTVESQWSKVRTELDAISQAFSSSSS